MANNPFKELWGTLRGAGGRGAVYVMERNEGRRTESTQSVIERWAADLPDDLSRIVRQRD